MGVKRIIIAAFIGLSLANAAAFSGDKDKMLKMADHLYERKSYFNAIDLYRELKKQDPKNEYILFKLGASYYHIRDYANAEETFSYLKNAKKVDYPLAWFYYGEVLQTNRKYEEAKKAFLAFLKIRTREKEIRAYQGLAKNEIASCDVAVDLLGDPNKYTINVETLEGNVNKAYSDFAPQILDSKTLMFTSIRADSVIKYDAHATPAYRAKIYRSELQQGAWSEPEEFAGVNDDFLHTGNGVFSPDGKFYFTRCHQDKLNNTICHIYCSEKKGDEWEKPYKVKGKLNLKGYTSTQPTFGTYQRRRSKYPVLYFVSDRPKGRGGLDIWYALMKEDGSFDAPRNLGPRINTPRDETAPFYLDNKQILYFSSNYWGGLGGYDIFKSEGYLNRWSAPVNPGVPVNSSYDDAYYVTDDDETYGYLVSNRPGGIALKHETCCDDIYRFSKIVPDRITLAGTVQHADTLPIKDVSFGIIPRKELAALRASNAPDSVLMDTIQWLSRSTPAGDFEVKFWLDNDYELAVYKDGYDMKTAPMDSLMKVEASRLSFDMNKRANPNELKSLDLDIAASEIKEGEVFLLDNMYFDLDKDNYQESSLESLTLLLNFLNAYPNVKIEVAGHTDSLADDDYNMDLSERRARTIRTFLIDNGIAPGRVEARGYGEKLPIAPNVHPDGSDNPEGRQLNRRTEIKILSSN